MSKNGRLQTAEYAFYFSGVFMFFKYKLRLHFNILTHGKSKISLFLLCYNLDNAQQRCALTTSDILHSSNLFLSEGAVPGF